MPEFEAGCYVTIGDSTLTWQVLPLVGHHPAARLLKSGQTGRRRLEWVENLKPYPWTAK